MTMEAKVETITPEMAKMILEDHNPDNRRINEKDVRGMARDILDGRWNVHHQGIAFDEDGNLLDGQHRLTACIKADRAIQVLVTRGVPRESRTSMDLHRKRTVVDSLKLDKGLVATNRHSSIARAMYLGRGCRNKFTRLEEVAFYIKHEKAVIFANDLTVELRRTPGVCPAPFSAVLGIAYYTEDQSDLTAFVEAMTTHKVVDDRDVCPILLRESYSRSSKGKKTTDQYRIWQFTIAERALSAFIRGQTLQRLLPSTAAQFTLPGQIDEDPILTQEALQ